MITNDDLRVNLETLIKQIDDQMDEIDRVATISGTTSTEMRHSNGSWVLADLLMAKARALHALTFLTNKEM